jgi:hypothetical protein
MRGHFAAVANSRGAAGFSFRGEYPAPSSHRHFAAMKNVRVAWKNSAAKSAVVEPN